MKDLGKVPNGGLATGLRKIQNDPDSIVRAIRATLTAIRFIKTNKDSTLALMGNELGIKDREISSMVYDDAVKLYSDTGIPSVGLFARDLARERYALHAVSSFLPFWHHRGDLVIIYGYKETLGTMNPEIQQ